jgi:hypothetical protein
MSTDSIKVSKRIITDSRNAMCPGLIGKVALIKSNNKPIHAANATKQHGPFYCKECLSEAIVRKCTVKDDHFAHKARMTLLYGSGESDLHQDCKKEILIALKEKFPDGNWAMEREIPENKDKGYSKLVPDISGRIFGKGVVIEVQRSYLNVKTITHRTTQYTNRGAHIIWIVPLKTDIGDSFFRPRLFERYLHSMYFGRVYYWMESFGCKVLPIHFQPAERWINESTWFDTDQGEERNEGGYWKIFRTIRKPNPAQLLDISQHFIFELAPEFVPENEELKVPERLIFKDNLMKWWSDEPFRT